MPMPAGATADCVAESTNLFDGYIGVGDQAYGASARITARPGGWCHGSPQLGQSFYSSWSMLRGPSNAWAQSGFDHAEDGSRVHFAQARNSVTVNSNFTLQSAQVGTSYKYWTVADSDCDCLRMYVNSTLLLETQWSPWDEWSKPWTPDYFGEVRDHGDDMPGTNAYKTIFDELKWHDGGAWQTDPALDDDNDNPDRWGLTPETTFCAVGPTCFGIWTK